MNKTMAHRFTKGLHLFCTATLLAGLALSVTPPQAAYAATFIVTKTADTNDGTCDADCSLREAIAAANAAAGADIITLPAGTYTLTIAGRTEEGNTSGDLDITDDLTINGAGAANTIVQAGTNATNGIDRVFHIPSPNGDGVTVTFNDLTIRYGLIHDEDGDVGDGAAIHNETGATVNINDCVITENTVDDGKNDAAIANQGLDGGGTININNCTISYNSSNDDGGGVFNLQRVGGTSTINIANSTISNNTTIQRGGGVYNEGGTVTISNSTISSNRATDSDDGDGGGVANRKGGTLIVSGTTFFGNESEDKGSAIYVEEEDKDDPNDFGTSLDVQNSVFDGNTATDDGTVACHKGATCTISTSTFSGNTSGDDGAGLYVSDSDTQATVTTSTFSGNTAGEDAGGVYASDGATLTLTNVTISGNYAAEKGGGIYTTYGPTLIVINSTIADNQAGDDGGGLDVSSSGSHTLRNTIVAGNSADDAGDNCQDTITNGGYNIDSGDTCGWGSANGSMENTDPLLDPLANNGGPTETRALQAGSPAIDAIPEGGTGYNGAPATDQRGVSRPQPPGGACDIGAYEVQPPPEPIGGIAVPVNKLGLLAPWMGLVALAAVAALKVALIRRRRG